MVDSGFPKALTVAYLYPICRCHNTTLLEQRPADFWHSPETLLSQFDEPAA